MVSKKRLQPTPLAVSEPLTATLKDGREVTGTLWLHPSKRGSFEVEYEGRRHSDYRNDYSDTPHIRMSARMILREMAEKS